MLTRFQHPAPPSTCFWTRLTPQPRPATCDFKLAHLGLAATSRTPVRQQIWKKGSYELPLFWFLGKSLSPSSYIQPRTHVHEYLYMCLTNFSFLLAVLTHIQPTRTYIQTTYTCFAPTGTCFHKPTLLSATSPSFQPTPPTLTATSPLNARATCLSYSFSPKKVSYQRKCMYEQSCMYFPFFLLPFFFTSLFF
jgi:hypothetical protein